MSTNPDPKREHPSTYFVQDRSNQDELTRVLIQDQMVTNGMGGVLPEQPDPGHFERVLDVGCGTGNWLLRVAETYPTIERLVGVDVSGVMLAYARTEAEARGLGARVEFRMMDVLRLLEFPAGAFSLINQRFGMSYLRTWDWSKLLNEYLRVLRGGGVIRITESEMLIESTSPALTRLSNIALEAVYGAGHFFTPQSDGVISQLEPLLTQYGLLDVQTHSYMLVYRAGIPEGQHFYENMSRAFRNALPFYRKWAQVPADYEEIYQQALSEMQQPDFVATWHLLTAFGTKPLR